MGMAQVQRAAEGMEAVQRLSTLCWGNSWHEGAEVPAEMLLMQW